MLTSSTLSITLSGLSDKYNQAVGSLNTLKSQAAEKRASLEKNQKDIECWRLTQILLTKTSEFARAQSVRQVESLVTSALQAVFGDESLTFRISLGDRGGQPCADWEVVSRFGDVEIANDPGEARGGGIVDVVSVALRLAIHRLTKNQGPLVLDEIAKMVSAEYQPALAYFIREFAAKTNTRIIMVTHSATLAEAGNLGYRVTQKDGKSEVAAL